MRWKKRRCGVEARLDETCGIRKSSSAVALVVPVVASTFLIGDGRREHLEDCRLSNHFIHTRYEKWYMAESPINQELHSTNMRILISSKLLAWPYQPKPFLFSSGVLLVDEKPVSSSTKFRYVSTALASQAGRVSICC